MNPETAVLGAAMHSPTALTECAPLLTADDFEDPKHGLIWDAITTLHDAGQTPDPVAVSTHLGSNLARVGGVVYLADLYTATFVTTNATHYARMVRDTATRRRVTSAAMRITQLATATDLPGDQLVALATAEVEASYRPDPTGAQTRVGDHIDAVIDDLNTPDVAGIPWPWSDLNRTLNPLTPGKLIVCAARPGVGKSVTLVDIARDWAIRRNKTVVLFTLEMTAHEVIRRILAAEARVPVEHLERKTLTRDDWSRIAEARARLADAPLHIIDDSQATIADLRAAVTTYEPSALLVDYLQIAGLNPRLERRAALEEYTRSLKRLAMNHNLSVVTAAQLNRQVEQRTDRTPHLADLRETGTIEQDADAVILLSRPDLLDPNDRPGEVDMIVAKQRGGKTGVVTLVHQLHYARFVDGA